MTMRESSEVPVAEICGNKMFTYYRHYMHFIYDNFSNILWSDFSFFYRDFIGILCVLAVVFCFLNSRFFTEKMSIIYRD